MSEYGIRSVLRRRTTGPWIALGCAAVAIGAAPVSAQAPINLTGIWRGEVIWSDIGFPVAQRDIDWAPLSAGAPEEREPPDYDTVYNAAVAMMRAELEGNLPPDGPEGGTFGPQLPLTDAGKAAAAALAARADELRAQRHGCYPSSILGQTGGSVGFPLQILQVGDRVVIIDENSNVRTIFLDGRSDSRALRSWSGFSVGDWEGDTLVVETTKIKGEHWGGFSMNPLSPEARLTEYYSLNETGDLLTVKSVFEDPTYYAEPLAKMVFLDLRDDIELILSSCVEGLAVQEDYSP